MLPDYTRTWTNIGGFNGWTRTKLEMRRLERDDRRLAAALWVPERHHVANVLAAESGGYTAFDDQRSKAAALMFVRCDPELEGCDPCGELWYADDMHSMPSVICLDAVCCGPCRQSVMEHYVETKGEDFAQ